MKDLDLTLNWTILLVSVRIKRVSGFNVRHAPSVSRTHTILPGLRSAALSFSGSRKPRGTGLKYFSKRGSNTSWSTFIGVDGGLLERPGPVSLSAAPLRPYRSIFGMGPVWKDPNSALSNTFVFEYRNLADRHPSKDRRNYSQNPFSFVSI